MTLGLEQGGRCIDEGPVKITAPSSTMPKLVLTESIIFLSYKMKNRLTGMLSLSEVKKVYL